MDKFEDVVEDIRLLEIVHLGLRADEGGGREAAVAVPNARLVRPRAGPGIAKRVRLGPPAATERIVSSWLPPETVRTTDRMRSINTAL